MANRNPQIKDIAGQRFGRLTVLSFSHCKRAAFWLCRCDCGNERTMAGGALRFGSIRSCGCLTLDTVTKHGLYGTPTWVSWNSMRTRCENPKAGNFKAYGARGITVCDRWKSFINFVADMGERPSGTTLDRYPNKEGNYEPGNCRWATATEQQSNKRTTKLYEFNGERLTVREISNRTGVDHAKLEQRIGRYRWAVERAITTP